MLVVWRPRSCPRPKAECPHACYSIPGAQGEEAERAQRLGALRGLLAPRQDHRLGLPRQRDESVGCECVSTDTIETDTPEPSAQKLTPPLPAAASLGLKAEKQRAHSGNVVSVAFSPDGKTIVSGSQDDTIKVWDAGGLTPAILPLFQT